MFANQFAGGAKEDRWIEKGLEGTQTGFEQHFQNLICFKIIVNVCK
jgi:hypothetical protein